ncbi:MAG TPA: M50 family metallopeptidase [Phycisphaerae bacterium]|nr:M50 family metallopeptidase [Phycisphaerae bacterium]
MSCRDVPLINSNSAKSPAAWRMLYLSLFLLPLAYLALLFSVAIHEVLGHGMAACRVGGFFHGFRIGWDGGGLAWAFAPKDARPSAEIFVLANGVLAQSEVGILCLLVAMWFRKRRLFLFMTLLLFAFFCLTGASSYIFWSLYPSQVAAGPSASTADLARILHLTGNPWLRTVLMPASGVLFVVFTALGMALFFEGIERFVAGQRLHGVTRAVALMLFVVIPGVGGWFLFDWDTVIPGIGRLPCVTGAAVHLFAGALLYRWSLRPCAGQPELETVIGPTAAAWTLILGMVLALGGCLNHGLYWGPRW